MSQSKNVHKLSTDTKSNVPCAGVSDDQVTVTQKPNGTSEENIYLAQRSYINIHSTDRLCQVPSTHIKSENNHVEVININEVFPATSEESFTVIEDSLPPPKKRHERKFKSMPKVHNSNNTNAPYGPTNSRSSTVSARHKVENPPLVYSDFDIPKSTLYVIGSNPGEPKMSYADPPKKITKSMKKYLRNIEKQKCDKGNAGRCSASEITMRGILKDGRFGPECTGSTSMPNCDDYPATANEETIPYQNFDPQTYYAKNFPNKNVTFNTQVVTIHFTGDLCVGQSVETLSKEKDQQARNSELRKTFLTKYNEFWPTQK